MARYLLGSTILLSTALFSVNVHAASVVIPSLQTPTLKISGQTSFNNWFFENKHKTLNNSADKNPCNRQKFGRGQLFTVDDSKLKFTVSGKLDTGMEYGLVIVLDGNRNKDKIVRENYLFFEGSWGKILAGDTYGVQNFMSFGGFSEWGGTGFIDGPLDRVVNFTTGVLHSVDLVGDTSRNTKLTYVSPRWNGIQAGISYTPQTEHIGEAPINSQTSVASPKQPFGADNVASGINFIHKFSDDFEMALSATSIFDKARPEYHGARKRHRTASFAFGGDFTLGDIGFGAEYGNNLRSREFAGQDTRFKSNAGQFLDFGLSYTWGATKLSAGYYYGWRNTLHKESKKRKKAKTNAFQTAVDHKLAPGLGVYFEYSHIQMNNPKAKFEAKQVNNVLEQCKQFDGLTKSNRANVFIIGSRLVF